MPIGYRRAREGAEKAQGFLKESDVKYISEMGFEHVRLPIGVEQMWDENGARQEEAFELLEDCTN